MCDVHTSQHRERRCLAHAQSLTEHMQAVHKNRNCHHLQGHVAVSPALEQQQTHHSAGQRIEPRKEKRSMEHRFIMHILSRSALRRLLCTLKRPTHRQAGSPSMSFAPLVVFQTFPSRYRPVTRLLQASMKPEDGLEPLCDVFAPHDPPTYQRICHSAAP